MKKRQTKAISCNELTIDFGPFHQEAQLPPGGIFQRVKSKVLSSNGSKDKPIDANLSSIKNYKTPFNKNSSTKLLTNSSKKASCARKMPELFPNPQIQIKSDPFNRQTKKEYKQQDNHSPSNFLELHAPNSLLFSDGSAPGSNGRLRLSATIGKVAYEFIFLLLQNAE